MLDTGSGKPDYIRTQAIFITLNLVSGLHSPSKISFIIIAGRQAAKRKIASIMARKQYNKNNQEEQHKKENITSEPGRHNFTDLARARLICPAVSPSHPSHRYTLSLAWPRSQWVVLHVSGPDLMRNRTAYRSGSRGLAKAMSSSLSTYNSCQFRDLAQGVSGALSLAECAGIEGHRRLRSPAVLRQIHYNNYHADGLPTTIMYVFTPPLATRLR